MIVKIFGKFEKKIRHEIFSKIRGLERQVKSGASEWIKTYKPPDNLCDDRCAPLGQDRRY